jgi:hypothetical protein
MKEWFRTTQTRIARGTRAVTKRPDSWYVCTCTRVLMM